MSEGEMSFSAASERVKILQSQLFPVAKGEPRRRRVKRKGYLFQAVPRHTLKDSRFTNPDDNEKVLTGASRHVPLMRITLSGIVLCSPFLLR